MRKIENIIIHCSDSLWRCTREIRQWHLKKGWRDVGYQFIILNGRILPDFYLAFLDGMVECGRYIDEDLFMEQNEVGSHTLGYNDHSIGICLIGKRLPNQPKQLLSVFTLAQMDALIKLLKELKDIYEVKVPNIIGHCETESGKAQGKTCPDFDVSMIRKALGGEG